MVRYGCSGFPSKERRSPSGSTGLGCVLLLTLLGHAAGAGRAEPNRYEAELGRVRQSIESTAETHKALGAVRDSVNDELAAIERRYGVLARQVDELEAEIRQRDQHIIRLKEQQDALIVSIREQRQLLSGQLRGAHAIGRKDWLKLLLNQEEPSQIARMLAYYGYLNRARMGLIERWGATNQQLKTAQTTLEAETRHQTEARKRLTKERQSMANARDQRRILLAAWNRELNREARDLDQLEEDEARLQTLIAEAAGRTRGSSSLTTGAKPPEALPPGRGRCPPVGKIVTRFGSPRLNGVWDGLIIAGAEGAPVRAVSAGRIVFADWLRGYGLMTIVDHGNGLMSLYAYNQYLYKSVGDTISPGDVLATIGMSGGRKQPGLYFGIRQHGQAIDPITWCRRQSS